MDSSAAIKAEGLELRRFYVYVSRLGYAMISKQHLGFGVADGWLGTEQAGRGDSGRFGRIRWLEGGVWLCSAACKAGGEKTACYRKG